MNFPKTFLYLKNLKKLSKFNIAKLKINTEIQLRYPIQILSRVPETILKYLTKSKKLKNIEDIY